MFPTPGFMTLDPERTHSPSKRLGAQWLQSHPAATPWSPSPLPGRLHASLASPGAGKSHHRGRSPRLLASQLGLPTPTAPDTAASAVVTYCEGGGLRQTCWASSCPEASQCPRRGGTWVGHNGTSPPARGSLIQPRCFPCLGRQPSSLAELSRESSPVTVTHACTHTPHPLRDQQWKNTSKQKAHFSANVHRLPAASTGWCAVGRQLTSLLESPQLRRGHGI